MSIIPPTAAPKANTNSEDMSEILGTPPSLLVQWGTTVILVVFSLLLVAGWVIRYPDVITARVEFTTAVPPVDVVARTEGHIQQFLVADNEQVEEGRPLVVLENTAIFRDIQALDALVRAWESADTPDSLLRIAPLAGMPMLGELRNEYAVFIQQLEQYQFSKGSRQGASSANVQAVQQQIHFLQNGIRLDQSNQRKAATELESLRQSFQRKQQYQREGLISASEVESLQEKVAATERMYNSYNDQILRRQTDISSLQRSIGMVRFDDSLDANSSAGRLKATLGSLRTALDRWKLQYLLTAPIAGKISLSKFYTAGQYVKQGEQVLVVVPPTDTRIIGRSQVPVTGSGKIKPNQRVVIRLDNYPYYEFGTLSGVVLSKSLVPKDNSYIVTIGLDSIGGATTSYDQSIVFQQQLQGEADIITADKRFLQRIADQLFAKAR